MMSYKLIKPNNPFGRVSADVCYITFFGDGTFKMKYLTPKVGRSLLMSPFNACFTWQTTPITKIIEKKKDYLHFLTKHSEYKLYKE